MADFQKHFGRFLIAALLVYPLWHLATEGQGLNFIESFVIGAVLMLGVIWSGRE